MLTLIQASVWCCIVTTISIFSSNGRGMETGLSFHHYRLLNSASPTVQELGHLLYVRPSSATTALSPFLEVVACDVLGNLVRD